MERTLTDNHIITRGDSVRDALARLNALSGGNMTLFVADDGGRLLGSLTDGDIRRALTAGASLDTPAGDICHRSCLAVTPGSDNFELSLKARRKGIFLLPVTDADNRITGLADLRRIKALLPLDAVLMAGGRGERLRPLTLQTPKPLLPVGGKPIIDYNIEALHSYGVSNIFVTVNYLREQIIDHFSDPDSGVICVEEPRRLGTMGSLALVDGLSHDNLILMNSDLLTNVDFAMMFRHHRDSGADITMATVPYSISVPFAIIETDSDRVTALREKPTYNYMANAGIYMLRRSIASEIKPGEYLDAPDMVQRVIDHGGKVSWFPIDGTWIDIGTPDDYRSADILMRGK